MPLQDSDNFIVGRGTDSYKITYQDLKDDLNYVPPPSGTIDQPTVLEPNDGAGGGDTRYLKSDAITDVEGGGIKTCETDTIESVYKPTSYEFRHYVGQQTIDSGSVTWTNGTYGQTVDYGNTPTGDGTQPTYQLLDFGTPSTLIYSSSSSGVQYVGFWKSSDGIAWTFDSSHTTTGSAGRVGVSSSSSKYWLITKDQTSISNVENASFVPASESIFNNTAWFVDAEVYPTLIFPSSNGFGCFEPGDVVQDPDVKVISKDADVNTITVDGGTWTENVDKLVKETPYDTKLTVAGSTDLADMTGATFMSDGSGAPGPYTQTPYKLTTTEIADVQDNTVVSLKYAIAPTYIDSGVSDQTGLSFDKTWSSGETITDQSYIIIDTGSKDATFKVSAAAANSNLSYSDDLINWKPSSYQLIGNVIGDEGRYYWTAQYPGLLGNGTGCTLDSFVPTEEIELTFPDAVSTNPDLQYFKPGDVVQGPSWNQSQTWSANVNNGATPVNAYDGNLATFDYGSSYTNTFTTPLTVSKLRVYADGPQDSVQVYLDGVVVTVSWSGSVTKQWWDVPISGSAVFSQVTITHSSAALYAVEADGKILVDAGIAASGAVKVVSVDPDSNTMVVDGGEWGAYLKGNWSNGASGGINRPGYEPDKAFDGDLTTFFNPEDSQSATFSFTGLTIQNSLRLYCRGDNGNLAVTLGGVQQQITTDTGAAQWRSATVSGPVAFTSIDFASSSPALYAVEVDGKILVDAVEDSQVWSSYGSSDVVDGALFDGDLSTYGGGTFDYQFNTDGPTASSSIEVYFDTTTAYSNTVTINGSANLVPLTQGTQWVDVTTQVSLGQITRITGTHSGGNATGLLGVKIDGKLLIDQGVRDLGDSRVEYQTKGGQGDIIEVNTDDNTIVLSDTGDRDNRWIKGFSVAGPSVIDEPLLTNDVELRVSDFATTPPGADTLKEIIWSINGTEYSANTTNPWSPLDKLPTNTSVTVKVKYKGNTLEDSDWSPNVTFTTGANMRSLFTRIAALEANDVTDDATDTALLTLIAGLAARIQALEDAN